MVSPEIVGSAGILSAKHLVRRLSPPYHSCKPTSIVVQKLLKKDALTPLSDLPWYTYVVSGHRTKQIGQIAKNRN